MREYENMKECSLFFWMGRGGGLKYNGLYNIKGVSINEIDISIALQHKSLPTSILRFSSTHPYSLSVKIFVTAPHQVISHSLLTAQQCGSLVSKQHATFQHESAFHLSRHSFEINKITLGYCFRNDDKVTSKLTYN